MSAHNCPEIRYTVVQNIGRQGNTSESIAIMDFYIHALLFEKPKNELFWVHNFLEEES